MILDIFLIIVVLISLFFLLSILISKFTILSKIEVGRISKEKERKTKTAILQKRFIAAIKNLSLTIRTTDFISKRLDSLKHKFNGLEIKYKERFIQLIKESPVEVEIKVEKLLSEGSNLLNGNNLDDAEKKFSEIICFDPRNLVALKSLFKIYFTQNQLSKAKSIGEYLLKINKQALKWWQKFNKNKANIPDNLTNELFLSLVNLGDLYLKLDKKDAAAKHYKSALSYNPNNPKMLDFLIENSIILEKKEEATNYLDRIRVTNSDNQKISEWEEKIKKLE